MTAGRADAIEAAAELGKDAALEPAEAVRFGALSETLGFLLRIAQVRDYERFFEHAGDLGIKPGEFSVLWLIHLNPGIRQGVLARNLSIKRAHMAKLVRALHLNRVIARKVPKDDRRALELRLTEKGEAMVREKQAAFFAVPSGGHERLSADEQARLRDLLRKLTGLSEDGL